MLHLEEKLNADCLLNTTHGLIAGTQFFFKKPFWNKRIHWQQINLCFWSKIFLCHDCRLLLTLEFLFCFFLLTRQKKLKIPCSVPDWGLVEQSCHALFAAASELSLSFPPSSSCWTDCLLAGAVVILGKLCCSAYLQGTVFTEIGCPGPAALL